MSDTPNAEYALIDRARIAIAEALADGGDIADEADAVDAVLEALDAAGVELIDANQRRAMEFGV